MQTKRRQTRPVHLGPVQIGGTAPVAVQSMTNTDTRDPGATLAQIQALALAGCEVVRCAVPDREAALAFRAISDASPLPVVADVHFDPELAVTALENGAAGLRINPGNIKSDQALDRVVHAARAAGAPIRVGANSGSLPRDILEACGGPTPQALVDAALGHVRRLNQRGFQDIKVSLKSSNVLFTIEACRLWAGQSDLPQHLGVTEAGGLLAGAVKSAVGLGVLLLEGIGDTIRISLTADPVREVQAAWHLLRACGLRRRGVELISCPTCGRTEIDLMGLVDKAEAALAGIKAPLTVAVMGCVVNGPGEAAHADVGVAGGRGQGVLFAGGKVMKKIPEQRLLEALVDEVRRAQDDYFKSNREDAPCD